MIVNKKISPSKPSKLTSTTPSTIRSPLAILHPKPIRRMVSTRRRPCPPKMRCASVPMSFGKKPARLMAITKSTGRKR